MTTIVSSYLWQLLRYKAKATKTQTTDIVTTQWPQWLETTVRTPFTPNRWSKLRKYRTRQRLAYSPSLIKRERIRGIILMITKAQLAVSSNIIQQMVTKSNQLRISIDRSNSNNTNTSNISLWLLRQVRKTTTEIHFWISKGWFRLGAVAKSRGFATVTMAAVMMWCEKPPLMSYCSLRSR